MTRLLVLLVVVVTACAPSPRAARRAASGPPSDSEQAVGEGQFWRDQFDSARTTLHAVIADADRAGDSAARARALTWLSRASYRLGEYQDAIGEGEAASALSHRLGLREELFQSRNVLGLVAWNQGRLVEAESLLTEAATAARADGNPLNVSKAAANLGLVQVELGDYFRARAGFQTMLEAGRQFGDARATGNALANLAMLDIREGNPQGALARLNEARAVYRTVGYGTGEANALGQLATAWRDLGDLQAALEAADSALVLAQRLGLRQEEAAELEVLATLHRELGDGSAALRRLRQAQAINTALDLRVETGTDQRREAEIRLEQGQRAAAVAGGLTALATHSAAGARPERLADLLFLAAADSTRSDQWLRAARALADSLQSRRARADVALAEAQLALARRQWRRAVSALASSGFDETQADASLRWQFADAEARAHRGLGNWPSAEDAARRAVAAVERVRGTLGASWSRARFLASRAGSFATLVEVLLAQNRVEAAFQVADAARGRALLEHLGAMDSSDTHGDQVLSALATRERTLRRIDDLERQLAAPDLDASPAGARTRVRLRRQLSDLQTAFSDAALTRNGAAPVLGGGPVELSALGASLSPDEAVIEYLIGTDRVHAFIVRGGRLVHRELPLSVESLAGRIRIARDLLGRPGPAPDVLPVLEALEAELIAPIRADGSLDGVQRLVIIPQGVLSYLAFAALRNGTGHYLVEDFAILTAPSAAAVVELRRSARGVRAERIGAFAPFPSELPGTAAELDGIAGVIRGTRVWRGREATEAAARKAAGAPGILHLATHGVLNPDNPLFSRIELWRSDTGSSDGRLEVHEILGLGVRSSLVYLSGCETALGPMGAFTRGDDLVTLSQSFLFAGAATVVATLWRIPDAGSVPLVRGFYRALTGSAPPEALAAAQRSLIASEAYASPYYWAGFVMSGSGAAK